MHIGNLKILPPNKDGNEYPNLKALIDRLIDQSQFSDQNFSHYFVTESLVTKILGDQFSDNFLIGKSVAKLVTKVKGDSDYRFLSLMG